MIDRARELLRLAADGTHVSGTEWVPVVEGLVRDAERYRLLRNRGSIYCPVVHLPFEPDKGYTAEGLDDACDAVIAFIDAAIADSRPKP